MGSTPSELGPSQSRLWPGGQSRALSHDGCCDLGQKEDYHVVPCGYCLGCGAPLHGLACELLPVAAWPREVAHADLCASGCGEGANNPKGRQSGSTATTARRRTHRKTQKGTYKTTFGRGSTGDPMAQPTFFKVSHISGPWRVPFFDNFWEFFCEVYTGLRISGSCLVTCHEVTDMFEPRTAPL